MKLRFLIGLLLLPLPLLAQPDHAPKAAAEGQLVKIHASLEKLSAQLDDMQARQHKLAGDQKNPLAFCYLAERAYSEGAIVGNSACTRSAADKLEDSHKYPLAWVQRSTREPARAGKK